MFRVVILQNGIKLQIIPEGFFLLLAMATVVKKSGIPGFLVR
jgi:hypothetical protein